MGTTVKVFGTAALAAALALFGCSSSDTPTGPTGGPVPGAQDTHCDLPDGGVMAQVTHLDTCHLPLDAGTADYGPTEYNAEGNDDDCKYHVAFTVSPVRQNENVTFTVTATTLVDGMPATGANTLTEVFLNNVHPAPNSGVSTQEMAGGVYQIGPILFDEPGQWTVRFHLHEECQDESADSPHGHAAFYISVP